MWRPIAHSNVNEASGGEPLVAVSDKTENLTDRHKQMAHGGYGKRRVKPADRRSKSLGVAKKPKSASLKNQIRSVERMLRKDLPLEMREAQLKKLEDLQMQQELHSRLAAERKIFLRDRKIKFFERRKIERRIRRLEKMQRNSADHGQSEEVAEQLSKYKEDLQYVTYFPKTEKYVPLYSGGDNSEIVDRRNRLRKQIKARLSDAAKSGKDLEETGSEDDGLVDMSEDDFFLSGSSSDEADADDEWTDKSTREQASSASGKAVSGMSSDERNQRQIFARALMPPPRAHKSSSAGHGQSRFGSASIQNRSVQNAEMSMSSNTLNSASCQTARGSSNSKTSHGSNLSSNSDAHKPRRKRRHRKKKK